MQHVDVNLFFLLGGLGLCVLVLSVVYEAIMCFALREQYHSVLELSRLWTQWRRRPVFLVSTIVRFP
jgi:hypothetical protein